MTTVLENEIFKISELVKNQNFNFNKAQILNHLPEKYIDEAIDSIESWETYKPTPLHNLNKLNEVLKLNNIFYKDEGYRFDLKSFKALGWCFCCKQSCQR